MLKPNARLVPVCAFAFAALCLACSEANFQRNSAVPVNSASNAVPVEPSDPNGDEPNEAPVTPPEDADLALAEESFTQQGVNGLVDIALVIDDSGSMQEEQNNLSTKLNDLVVSLKDANWQIGVVTTTVSSVLGIDRCKLTLIKSSDNDSEEKFIKAVTPGVNGDGNEQGIRAAVNALKCNEKPWVRPNSTVAVLIVSDEDNCSDNGSDCLLSASRSEQFLIDYVEQDLKRDVGRNAGFYGIFAPPSESCPTAGQIGKQYQKLVDYKANGSQNYGNICDSSYKSTLERISGNIAKLLSSQFTLKHNPSADSVAVQGVKSNGDAITAADYRVDGNVITFRTGSEPALGSDINVTYKYSAVISH